MAAKKRNIWPFGSRTTYRVTRKPGPGLVEGAKTFKGYKVWQYGDVWKTSADPESTFDSAKDAKAFISWLKRNPGKAPKSAAYEAGRRALAAAAAKLGTVNLSPSMAQRDDWGWSWREFMAGWNAEKKAVPNPAKLGVYTLTLRQGSALPSRSGVFTSLTNARKAAAKEGSQFIGEVLDSTKKLVGYVIPPSGFTVGQLRDFVERHIGNPGSAGSAFARCVASVSAKGSVADPGAVCAAAGRKKYGAKKFAAMAEAGRKRAVGAARNTPNLNPAYYWPRATMQQAKEALHSEAQHRLSQRTFKGLYPVSWQLRDGFPVATGANGVKLWFQVKNGVVIGSPAAPSIQGVKLNPAGEAAAVYEEFHGRPSAEVVTVTEKIHFHEHLAALGELRTLVIQARDGSKVTLSRFKRAILCTNEAKNQMFIRGGDQSVDLALFGIRKPHEVETLGRVVELAYFTRKDHLGSEGGTAIYFHVTGETNENGRRKMSGWAPDLIYRTLDEALEFSGGSYTIRAEGIDK